MVFRIFIIRSTENSTFRMKQLWTYTLIKGECVYALYRDTQEVCAYRAIGIKKLFSFFFFVCAAISNKLAFSGIIQMFLEIQRETQ